MEPKSLYVNTRFPREEVAREVVRVMDDKEWTRADVCARTGVDHRVLNRLLNGPSETELKTRCATGDWVELTTVDRLFTRLGLIHLFWDEPFRSVYFHESITDPCGWHKKVKKAARDRLKRNKRRTRRKTITRYPKGALKECAEAVGVHPTTVSKVVNHHRYMSSYASEKTIANIREWLADNYFPIEDVA